MMVLFHGKQQLLIIQAAGARRLSWTKLDRCIFAWRCHILLLNLSQGHLRIFLLDHLSHLELKWSWRALMILSRCGVVLHVRLGTETRNEMVRWSDTNRHNWLYLKSLLRLPSVQPLQVFVELKRLFFTYMVFISTARRPHFESLLLEQITQRIVLFLFRRFLFSCPRPSGRIFIFGLRRYVVTIRPNRITLCRGNHPRSV